jgi:hypothetical protein
MNRNMKFVFAAIWLVAVVLACSGDKRKELGTAFMTALKTSDHDRSFAMLSGPLQKEVGGREGWGAVAEERKPTSFTYDTMAENTKGAGYVVLFDTIVDGEAYSTLLGVDTVGTELKIVGLQVNPRIPK